MQKMDDITTLTSAAPMAGAPAVITHQKPIVDTKEPPPNENTIESLELSEDLPVHSKLRNYIILIALAVYYSALVPSEHH